MVHKYRDSSGSQLEIPVSSCGFNRSGGEWRWMAKNFEITTSE